MINKKSSVRFLSIILATIITILMLLQTESNAATGKATTDSLRVREKASTESEVIDLLDTQDSFQVLGEEGEWYKISFKGKQGYASKSYVKLNGTLENNNSQNNNTENNNQENNSQENKSEANNNEENKQNEQQQNNQQPEDKTENTEAQNNNSENSNKVSNSKIIIEKHMYKISENSSINVLPVISSEIIGDIKKDEEVELVSTTGLWGYIKNNSISGWIRIDKLTGETIVKEEIEIKTENENNDTNNDEEKNSDEKESELNNNNSEEKNETDNKTDNKQAENTDNATVNYDSAKTLYVRPEAVNIRTKATTDSDIVNGLEQNAQVKVIGEQNDWYKVEYNGDYGFIRKDLLSDKKSEVTSRSNDFERTAQTQNTTNVNTTQSATQNTVQNTQPQQSTSSTGVTGADIAAYAQTFVGCKYVYGAAGPNQFDCSGLTSYVYKHFGYTLNRTSAGQATQGTPVSGELQPGDILVFSNDGKKVGHVGIYIGNDKFVHASDSTTGVIISNLHDSWNIKKYWGARRIL